jgi:hypothetical protein
MRGRRRRRRRRRRRSNYIHIYIATESICAAGPIAIATTRKRRERSQ